MMDSSVLNDVPSAIVVVITTIAVTRKSKKMSMHQVQIHYVDSGSMDVLYYRMGYYLLACKYARCYW